MFLFNRSREMLPSNSRIENEVIQEVYFMSEILRAVKNPKVALSR